jgi:drug/metabolite transporter (DMT)-like permease
MHRLKNWQLFAICVLTWGTTWYAITFQIGHTTAEVGVALRFGLAGAVVLAMCAARGLRLRFTRREHGLLALQGGFMYGLSYLCIYHAEQHVVSGLVAVGYSASPLISGLGARVLFGVRVSPRFVFGGLLGLAGVALIFWTEFGKAAPGSSAGSASAMLGALFTIASVLLSTVGSLTASRNRHHGLPFWPALGFGMLYGAAVSAVVALLQGQSFAPPAVASWWLSLLYLALAGSVLSFACFLTLQERIGPGPVGAVGVMTPLLALAISVLFEVFHPTWLTFAGAALAVAGNVLMLSPKRMRLGTASNA